MCQTIKMEFKTRYEQEGAITECQSQAEILYLLISSPHPTNRSTQIHYVLPAFNSLSYTQHRRYFASTTSMLSQLRRERSYKQFQSVSCVSGMYSMLSHRKAKRRSMTIW